MTRRLTVETVRERFSERGYELLEDHYKNNSQLLRFKCSTHPEEETRISLNRLTAGQGCRFCGYEKMGSNRSLTDAFVRETFTSKGYELLDRYSNSSTRLRYICSKHPDSERLITYSDLQQGYGCALCGRERVALAISGSNSHFWKGGVTELNNFLRQLLAPWKLRSLRAYDYRCAVSIINHKDIEIHHPKAFHLLRDGTLAELNLPTKELIGEYSEEELQEVSSVFIKKHSDLVGIPLRRSIHERLHQEFGDNPTMRDFMTFKDNYTKSQEEVTYGKAV